MIIVWTAPHPTLCFMTAVLPALWSPVSRIDLHVSLVALADFDDYAGPSQKWLIMDITIDGVLQMNPSLGLLDWINDDLTTSIRSSLGLLQISLSELGLQCGVNITMYSYNDSDAMNEDESDADDNMIKRMRLI